MKKHIFITIILILFSNICIAENEETIGAMRNSIKYQLSKYPVSRLQDIYKNFFQARFAGDHLITNKDAVMQYTKKELAEMGDTYIPHIENIG
jgi:hypothetical protein